MIHYFDNAATTPVRPEAVQAAVEAMTQGWGNPSSRYALGTQAAEAVKNHRAQVAAGLGCRPEELFFTSCGSEGDNWAIQGAVELGRRTGKHIITTAYEHAAVLEPCKALERQGYEVTYLQPDRAGNISLDDLEGALRPDTVLVSMMLVNNELGTVLPVAQAAKLVHQKTKALVHCDAVQGFLKVPFTPKELGVDLLTVSGHKIHAPKGIGALYIRGGLKFPPMIRGGGQENGLRSGTEATAQIAAFAAAAGSLTASGTLARHNSSESREDASSIVSSPARVLATEGARLTASNILLCTGRRSLSIIASAAPQPAFFSGHWQYSSRNISTMPDAAPSAPVMPTERSPSRNSISEGRSAKVEP